MDHGRHAHLPRMHLAETELGKAQIFGLMRKRQKLPGLLNMLVVIDAFDVAMGRK